MGGRWRAISDGGLTGVTGVTGVTGETGETGETPRESCDGAEPTGSGERGNEIGPDVNSGIHSGSHPVRS